MKKSLDRLSGEYERILKDLSKTNNELSRLYRELAQKTIEIEKINEWFKELLQATQREFFDTLYKSDEKYRIIAEFTYDWELWLDPQGNLLFCSSSVERVTGYSAIEFINNPELLTIIVHPDDRKTVVTHLRDDLSNTSDIFNLCFRIVSRSGDIRWINHYCIPVYASEKHYLGRRASNRDITEMKNTELKLEESLHEKEMLLREIHHRIKNNLSIVSSLLDLQASCFEHNEVRAAFQDSKARIAAIALIHNMLYQSEKISLVDMESYTRQLCALVQSSCIIPYRECFQVTVQAAQVFLDLDHAIPCGLIINELFTNSIKHAFPDRQTGNVRITFSLNESSCMLIFSDDGIGLPPHIDMTQTRTLGLQLVALLIEQLSGTIMIEREKGTTYRISFKI